MSKDDDGNDKDRDKTYSWRTGLPTKPDVDLLIKTWPNPKVGDRFEYHVIESLLGLSRENSPTRFRTVTDAWRDRMCEHRRVIECDNGIAFYVASGKQVSTATSPALLGIARAAKKHRKKLALVTAETDELRAEIAHKGRLMHEVERTARKAKMNVLPSTKTEASPTALPAVRNENKEA